MKFTEKKKKTSAFAVLPLLFSRWEPILPPLPDSSPDRSAAVFRTGYTMPQPPFPGLQGRGTLCPLFFGTLFVPPSAIFPSCRHAFSQLPLRPPEAACRENLRTMNLSSVVFATAQGRQILYAVRITASHPARGCTGALFPAARLPLWTGQRPKYQGNQKGSPRGRPARSLPCPMIVLSSVQAQAA